MVTVRVPATTANMGPGFDTIGMALDMFNLIQMEETGGGLDIHLEGEGVESISRNEGNIVYQVAANLFQRCGYRPKGLSIRLTGRIPVARGLGSSAAAVVGGLVAANVLAGEPYSNDELLNMACGFEGHPDNVAPALLGGIVVTAQLGEGLAYRQVVPPEKLKVVVAIPRFSLPTKAAREVLPASIPVQDAVFNISRTGLLVLALLEQDLELLGQVMDDRLHQPYRCRLIPGMEEVFTAAREAGALACALSGAGPTLVAFTDCSGKDGIREAMAEAFRKNKVDCTVEELSPSTVGAEIIS
ncbi:serine kinase [Clostridiales bacterium PH28_bin88]|nr:serine kinase [Clostridiales bacterium PH28_bin88]